MVKFNLPWEGPPVAHKPRKKRGWFTIDNETNAEEFAMAVDQYINGVWVRQLSYGRHGWTGPCQYIVANEPITKEKFIEWSTLEGSEQDIEESPGFEFESDLTVK